MELHQAAALALDSLESDGRSAADYRLIAAENRLGESPDRWRLTFKLRRLLPRGRDEEIGKGGEVFIEADIAAGTARLAGTGE